MHYYMYIYLILSMYSKSCENYKQDHIIIVQLIEYFSDNCIYTGLLLYALE